ncbi:MAG TPA: DUF4288 domain-containing protein [Longimicrobiaceae bacterium]|jgi:hypothetical protein|nr:DUF4288 domain-containing protein [Longimicrobiaceae bacterium]
MEENEDVSRSWFSTNVRLVCLIEDQGSVRSMECVHVFRSSGWESAFQRALELGRTHEESFVNVDGERVKWVLAEIVSLDFLRTNELNGAEVYSATTDVLPEGVVPFDHYFRPEESDPTQSV